VRGYTDEEIAEAEKHRREVAKQIRKDRTRKQAKAIRLVLLHGTALLTRREVATLTKQISKALEGIDL
jgi:hypothetical protein